jgi:hypothetical protein
MTSTTATQTIAAPAGESSTLKLRNPKLVPSPATAGFPCTTHIEASPFHDVQTGPTRTMLPVFDNLMEERQYRKEHLALVFRIMHRFKLAEGIAGEPFPALSRVDC